MKNKLFLGLIFFSLLFPRTARAVAPVCGNDAVETGEECDDGDRISGDGCNSNCQMEFPLSLSKSVTGDGLAIPEDWLFTIMPGNITVKSDKKKYLLPGTYQISESGPDHYVLFDVRGDCRRSPIDPGNLEITLPGSSGGNCDVTNAYVPYCGDESTNGPEEQCDGDLPRVCKTADNYYGQQICNSSCTWNSCQTKEFCGDGIVSGGEQCDDGNAVFGDGCSGICQREIVSVSGFVYYDRDKDSDGDGWPKGETKLTIPYFSFEEIKLGPLVLYTWGIFLALAISTVFVLVSKEGQKEGFSPNFFSNLLFWLLPGILVGSRLGYVLQFPKEYLLNPVEIFKFGDGGLTFNGGFFGGVIAAILFFKSKKLKTSEFWKAADLAALFLPLGIAVGRIGCFLINDHQGAVTSLPWAIIWPDGVARHPVALYLFVNALAIFFILNFLKSKLKKPGQVFFTFLFLYSISRFFLDFTRLSNTFLSDPAIFGLSLTQWASLVISAVAFWLLLKRK